jgi:hypothetical protein
MKSLREIKMTTTISLESNQKWDPRFAPCYTPLEMLEKGVFEGKYINAVKGLPASWYKVKKVLAKDQDPDPSINAFGIKSRQPLSVWKKNGWIKTDKNGWFEWYCHYFLGRRLGKEDEWQIGRWRSFVARHQGQIDASGKKNDLKAREKQRQGLLQWGWDSTKSFDEKTLDKNLERFKKIPGISVEQYSSLTDW